MSSCHISHHATAHPVTTQCERVPPLSLSVFPAPTCTPPVHSLAACVNVFLQRDSCVNQMSMSLHKKHIEETTGKLMLASKPTSHESTPESGGMGGEGCESARVILQFKRFIISSELAQSAARQFVIGFCLLVK